MFEFWKFLQKYHDFCIVSFQEDLTRLSSVRNLVGQLYGALNVDEHQLRGEREMLIELERLKGELVPLEEKREQINELALKRTNTLTWVR